MRSSGTFGGRSKNNSKTSKDGDKELLGGELALKTLDPHLLHHDDQSPNQSANKSDIFNKSGAGDTEQQLLHQNIPLKDMDEDKDTEQENQEKLNKIFQKLQDKQKTSQHQGSGNGDSLSGMSKERK